MSPSFVKIGSREGNSMCICFKNLVLAEISTKKPSYSRHARLTVDGALPTHTIIPSYPLPILFFLILRLIGSRSEGLFSVHVQNILIQCQTQYWSVRTVRTFKRCRTVRILKSCRGIFTEFYEKILFWRKFYTSDLKY